MLKLFLTVCYYETDMCTRVNPAITTPVTRRAMRDAQRKWKAGYLQKRLVWVPAAEMSVLEVVLNIDHTHSLTSLQICVFDCLIFAVA